MNHKNCNADYTCIEWLYYTRGDSCLSCRFFQHSLSPNNNLNEGTKFDDGKLRMDLIPPEVERALAEVLTYGAKKYDDRNWEKGIKYSRVYAALRRHLLAWVSGEIIDEESGLPHLNHALCCLAFLVTYEERMMDIEFDDLPYINRKWWNEDQKTS